MEQEGEAACQKANPKEHYPPRLGAQGLALPPALLEEEFVGWGTVRPGNEEERWEKIEAYNLLTNSLTQ